jgi:cell division protein ZapE
MTTGRVSEYFSQIKKQKSLQDDPMQDYIVELLDDRCQKIMQPSIKAKWLWWWPWVSRKKIQSLYLYGGVGRGKSLLMDLFYHVLPIPTKRRVHFHHFMFEVHEGLKGLRRQKNPLEILAKNLAKQCQVLCLDEFHVHDVADAMILGNLLRSLLAQRVFLLMTSNIHPAQLYEGGLQRSLFLPTIDLMVSSFEIVELDHGIDYRLRTLSQAKLWFPENDHEAFKNLFEQLGTGLERLPLRFSFASQEIPCGAHASGMMMVEAKDLIGRALGRNDYLHLTTEYHTLFIMNLYALSGLHDEAKRWIWLVDLCYDHRVKLVIHAAIDLEHVYPNDQRLSAEFSRTKSRMVEMQSKEYLASAHLTHDFSF